MTIDMEQLINKPNFLTFKKASVLLILFWASNAHGQSPAGLWHTIDDGDGKPRSVVRIEANGGGLEGKVVEIFLRANEPPDPLCDRCTGERKNARVTGMTFLWGFTQKGNEWTEGNILDPANGKTYRSKIWLEDSNTLKVRGYWGIFWRTQTWKRVG